MLQTPHTLPKGILADLGVPQMMLANDDLNLKGFNVNASSGEFVKFCAKLALSPQGSPQQTTLRQILKKVFPDFTLPEHITIDTLKALGARKNIKGFSDLKDEVSLKKQLNAMEQKARESMLYTLLAGSDSHALQASTYNDVVGRGWFDANPQNYFSKPCPPPLVPLFLTVDLQHEFAQQIQQCPEGTFLMASTNNTPVGSKHFLDLLRGTMTRDECQNYFFAVVTSEHKLWPLKVGSDPALDLNGGYFVRLVWHHVEEELQRLSQESTNLGLGLSFQTTRGDTEEDDGYENMRGVDAEFAQTTMTAEELKGMFDYKEPKSCKFTRSPCDVPDKIEHKNLLTAKLFYVYGSKMFGQYTEPFLELVDDQLVKRCKRGPAREVGPAVKPQSGPAYEMAFGVGSGYGQANEGLYPLRPGHVDSNQKMALAMAKFVRTYGRLRNNKMATETELLEIARLIDEVFDASHYNSQTSALALSTQLLPYVKSLEGGSSSGDPANEARLRQFKAIIDLFVSLETKDSGDNQNFYTLFDKIANDVNGLRSILLFFKNRLQIFKKLTRSELDTSSATPLKRINVYSDGLSQNGFTIVRS